jgi:hypothetical protein
MIDSGSGPLGPRPQLSEEEIMVIAGIPMDELRYTRAAQDSLAAARPHRPDSGAAAGAI